MDNDAMMQAALKSYGAANTPKNIAAMQNFFASNPDVLERRAMGMRGSAREDNSDVLQLDKAIGDVIDKSDGVTTQPVAAPDAASVQTMPARPNVGAPVPTAPVQGTRGAVVNTDPQMPVAAADSGSGGGSGDWIGPLLTALLGVSARPRAAVPGGDAVPMIEGPRASAPQARALPAPADPQLVLPAPNAQIEGPRNRITDGTLKGNVEDLNVDPINARKAMTKTANERQVKQDVEEENRSMDRMMQAEAERTRSQRSTEELARAAKKAVGRR